MSAGLFRVVRPFMLEGERQDAGRELSLDDGVLIAMLLDVRKIEPADAFTARRVSKKETVSWELQRETNNSLAPMLPTFVGMPARR